MIVSIANILRWRSETKQEPNAVYVITYSEPYEDNSHSSIAFYSLQHAKSFCRKKNRKIRNERRKYGCGWSYRKVVVRS